MSELTADELAAKKRFELAMQDPKKRQEINELIFELSTAAAKRGVHAYDLLAAVSDLRILTETQKGALRAIHRLAIENQVLRSQTQPPA